MSAKDNSDAAPGYRTLIPGQGPKPAPQAPTKPAAKPSATPADPKPPADQPTKAEGEKAHDDPTRYGDWEVKGRCIDF